MGTALVDPETTVDLISDDILIKEFTNPDQYKRPTLYGLMAKRANKNEVIKQLLFEVISNKKARKEYFLNTIIHAWLPALFVLEYGETKLKKDLRQVLINTWNMEERSKFLNYVKTKEEDYQLLRDIID